MALGDPFAQVSDLAVYMDLPTPPTVGSNKYVAMTVAIASATKEIIKYCGRDFNQAAAATPRVFQPDVDMRHCMIDDLWDPASVSIVTDPTGTNNFAGGITWTANDFELMPFNGIVDGETGWPYYELHACAGLWFPAILFRRYGTVQVTAKWGWPAIPSPIFSACLMMSAQNLKLGDAPLGVAGFSSYGAVRVRDIPMVEKKICKYAKAAGGALLVG